MNRITVGRASDNTIVIDHTSVSRHHACFYLKENGQLYITDLNSTNGVFINGIRTAGEHKVTVKDKVRFGDYDFSWHLFVIPDTVESNLVDTPGPHKAHGQSVKTRRFTGAHKMAMGAAALFVVVAIGVGLNWYRFTEADSPAVEADSWILKGKTIQYTIECLRDSSAVNELLGIGKEIKDNILTTDITISVDDEKKVGLEVKDQLLEKHKENLTSTYKGRIDGVMGRLLSSFSEKSRYHYEWYAIETEEINAYTAGGQIFVTTGMIDFLESDDELACVLGHEIYHNELGHINKQLREHAAIEEWFGKELGFIVSAATSLLTTSFNQENETYSDLYGLDHAVRAGYNGCAAIALWQRMSDREAEGVELEKLFRSHPFSKERVSCIRNHIEHNYYKTCN